jgi:hypothetical protein
MATKVFAVFDYGLYVGIDDVEAYAERNNEDAFDLLCEVGNIFNDAEGKCVQIMKSDASFNCDDLFAIFPLKNYPTLFMQAYESKEAALNELRENYAEYLPDDFDYEHKFVHLIGTVSG